LFILGNSPRSASAVHNLTAFQRAYGEDLVEVEVIDVQDNTLLAEQSKVVATPTLVRLLPLPSMRIVGDLSDQAVLASFITPASSRVM